MGKIIIRDPDYANLKAFADVLVSKGYKPHLYKAYAGRANTIEVEVEDTVKSIDIPLRKAYRYFGVLEKTLDDKESKTNTVVSQTKWTNKHDPFDREERATELVHGEEILIDNTRLHDAIEHNVTIHHENTRSLQTDRMISGNKRLKGE